MAQWRPDPTFYPSPKMAMQAPAEKLAFVAMLNPTHTGKPDALAVVDVDPNSSSYSRIVGQVEMPNVGDELHHFGWNACSSCLCPYAPHPHMERRYLIVPGIRSSCRSVRAACLDAVQERVCRGVTTLDPALEAVATRGPIVGKRIDRLWWATFDDLSLDAAACQRAVRESRGDCEPDFGVGPRFGGFVELGHALRGDGGRIPC